MTSEVMAKATRASIICPMKRTTRTRVRPTGELLREWRQRRRYSQLALACDAEISARHLSFLESGRSQPSRDMLLRLADTLEVPYRDRNVLLLSAGFAPVYEERPLDHPDLAAVRQAIELVLKAHEPYPALAVDRHWTLVAANGGLAPLLRGVGESLLATPANALRIALHPAGLAPRIANFPEWRTHLLARLQQQIRQTSDPVLASLMRELSDYPAPASCRLTEPHGRDAVPIVVPLKLRTENGILSFISTTMVFGTPVDVTSSELAIETFFPADEHTARALLGRRAEVTA